MVYMIETQLSPFGLVIFTPKLDEPATVASMSEEYCVEGVPNASRRLRNQVEVAVISVICV